MHHAKHTNILVKSRHHVGSARSLLSVVTFCDCAAPSAPGTIRGLPVDNLEAEKWFAAAASQGHPLAATDLKIVQV